MHVLMISYKSGLPMERVQQLFLERSERYRQVAGLQQKLYLRDPSTGEVGGLYLFDSKKDLDAFRNSDLEKSIERVYRVTGPLAIRTFEVVQTLHTQQPSSIAAAR